MSSNDALIRPDPESHYQFYSLQESRVDISPEEFQDPSPEVRAALRILSQKSTFVNSQEMQDLTNPPEMIEPFKRYEHAQKKITTRPYFMWILTAIHCISMIVSFGLNSAYQGTVIEVNPFNIMVGPSTGTLIRMGARFTPCMRPDTDYDDPNTLYACPAGTPTETFYVSPTTNITIPLCTLAEICGFGMVENETPNQWFRFILPVFLHSGLVHLLFNGMFQMTTGVQLEKDHGTLRILPIFIISSIGGFAFGGSFSKMTIPAVGSSGGLFGFVGCLYLDIIENWFIISRPLWELFKMTLMVLVAFFIGMLPGVDNYSHIGGFVFGIVSGWLFLKKVYYGSTDRWVKFILAVISVPIIIGLLAYFFSQFYQLKSECQACTYFNCLPGLPWCDQKEAL